MNKEDLNDKQRHFYKKPKAIVCMDVVYYQEQRDELHKELTLAQRKIAELERSYEGQQSKIISLGMTIGKLTDSIILLRDASMSRK